MNFLSWNKESSSLDDTDGGSGGLGSTGKNWSYSGYVGWSMSKFSTEVSESVSVKYVWFYILPGWMNPESLDLFWDSAERLVAFMSRTVSYCSPG